MATKSRHNKLIFGILSAVIAVLSLFISFAVVLDMIITHSSTDLIRTICSVNEKLIIPLGSIALVAYSILSGIIAKRPLLPNLWLCFVLLPTFYIGGVLVIALFGNTSVGYLFGELFLYCVIFVLILLISSCVISLITIVTKSSTTKWNAAKPVDNPEKMRKRSAKFYYRLAAVDAVFSLAFFASLMWTFYHTGDGYGTIFETLIILIFSIIFAITYGTIGYIKARKVFVPNMVLVGTSLLFMLIFFLFSLSNIGSAGYIPILVVYWLILLPFSFAGSVVTMLVVKLCVHMKNKNKAESPAE